MLENTERTAANRRYNNELPAIARKFYLCTYYLWYDRLKNDCGCPGLNMSLGPICCILYVSARLHRLLDADSIRSTVQCQQCFTPCDRCRKKASMRSRQTHRAITYVVYRTTTHSTGGDGGIVGEKRCCCNLWVWWMRLTLLLTRH